MGAEAFAFVNFARFAVPLRIGLALGTIPWIQENIVDVFLVDSSDNDNDMECEEEKKDAKVEERDPSVTATTMATAMTTADADESSVVQSTKDDEEEEEDIKPNGRFRIRVRLGNLINRALRRNNQSQQQEKE